MDENIFALEKKLEMNTDIVWISSPNTVDMDMRSWEHGTQGSDVATDLFTYYAPMCTINSRLKRILNALEKRK